MQMIVTTGSRSTRYLQRSIPGIKVEYSGDCRRVDGSASVPRKRDAERKRESQETESMTPPDDIQIADACALLKKMEPNCIALYRDRCRIATVYEWSFKQIRTLCDQIGVRIVSVEELKSYELSNFDKPVGKGKDDPEKRKARNKRIEAQRKSKKKR